MKCASPALAGRFFTTEPPAKPYETYTHLSSAATWSHDSTQLHEKLGTKALIQTKLRDPRNVAWMLAIYQ